MKRESLMRHRRMIAACALIGVLAAPQALCEMSRENKETVQQTLRSSLMSLARDEWFTRLNEDDWPVVIYQPAETIINLGLYVHPEYSRENDEEGPLVIAVTPDSAAARMGVRTGDRLRSIEDKSLLKLGAEADGGSRAFRRLQDALNESTGAIALTVQRGDQTLSLEGDLEKLVLPRAILTLSQISVETTDAADTNACATVSTQAPPPREFDVYPADVVSINGVQGGAGFRDQHFLTPDTYVFEVRPEIPDHLLDARAAKAESRRPLAILRLPMQAGFSYHIGARLLAARDQQTVHTRFWQPIVWKMEMAECTGKPVDRGHQ